MYSRSMTPNCIRYQSDIVINEIRTQLNCIRNFHILQLQSICFELQNPDIINQAQSEVKSTKQEHILVLSGLDEITKTAHYQPEGSQNYKCTY